MCGTNAIDGKLTAIGSTKGKLIATGATERKISRRMVKNFAAAVKNWSRWSKN